MSLNPKPQTLHAAITGALTGAFNIGGKLVSTIGATAANVAKTGANGVMAGANTVTAGAKNAGSKVRPAWVPICPYPYAHTHLGSRAVL